jgi:hypothetical protein
MSEKPIKRLRRRMIEDVSVRKFGEKTQHDYIRHIESFARLARYGNRGGAAPLSGSPECSHRA